MTEFISRGWVVTPFRRNVDDLETLAANADVIVFGWHLKYSDWETHYDALVDTVIAAAQINNATILFPGNVYIYGKTLTPFGDQTQRIKPRTPCAKYAVGSKPALNPLGFKRLSFVRATSLTPNNRAHGSTWWSAKNWEGEF
jgi:hypothetical protein